MDMVPTCSKFLLTLLHVRELLLWYLNRRVFGEMLSLFFIPLSIPIGLDYAWLFPLDQYVLRMDVWWMAQPPGRWQSPRTVAEAVHQSGTAKARGAASARVKSRHRNVAMVWKWGIPGHRTYLYQNSRNDEWWYVMNMMINIDQPWDDRANRGWHWRQLTFMFPSISQGWKHLSWGIRTKRGWGGFGVGCL